MSDPCVGDEGTTDSLYLNARPYRSAETRERAT